MKKLPFVCILAIAAFTSCSKKSNPNPKQPAPTSVTISGTSYSTVVIGNQTWTAVNYNGPGGVNYNNGANDPAYGKLYTFPEIQAVTLPSGWRLPTADDFNNLLIGFGGTKQSSGNYAVNQSAALKLMSTTGWTTTNGNNQTGFNALPAGYFDGANLFEYLGTQTFFMIDIPSGQNPYIPLSFSVAPLQTTVDYFFNGFGNYYHESVRFVKDN